MDNDKKIKEVSKIFTFYSKSLGETPTVGFTITYSNGLIENVISKDSVLEESTISIKKARNLLIKSIQKTEIR